MVCRYLIIIIVIHLAIRSNKELVGWSAGLVALLLQVVAPYHTHQRPEVDKVA